MGENSEGRTPGSLSIAIKDQKVLYAAYMNFVNDGGLFIPTKKEFKIGQTLPLVITLYDEDRKYPVQGSVVWITPVGSHGNKVAGIGVEFHGEQGKELRKKIEVLLAPILKSEKPTHTM